MELREEFESHPEIAASLSTHIWFGRDNLYHSTLINLEKLVSWLNGAWFMFQQTKQLKSGRQIQYELLMKGIVITSTPSGEPPFYQSLREAVDRGHVMIETVWDEGRDITNELMTERENQQ